MLHTVYISDEEYSQLKNFLPVLGKLIYSIDQSKQEEALYKNFDKLNKNGIFLNLNQKENSELKIEPKTYKKTLKIKNCDVHLRTRRCGNGLTYELRYRKDGFNINASSTDKQKAIKKFTEKLELAMVISTFPSVPATFHEFAMYYFENFRKRKVKPKTFENDLYRYNNHLKPVFGSIPIKKIMPAQCQSLIDSYLIKGQSKTADEVYSLLNVIIKMAIAHGLTERNPLAIIVKERHRRQHGTALTKDEEKFLLEKTAGTRYQLLFAVALYTGLRPNEYYTAQIKGNFIIAVNSKRKTKNTEYKRIPITPMLQPYLNKVTELQFPRLEYMRDKIKAILPHHKLYDLRTTFYTRCQECGVAEVARNEFVGHSLGVLGDTYTDLSDEFLLKEGKKLNY